MADKHFPQFGPEAMAQIDEYDLWLDGTKRKSKIITYLASNPYIFGVATGSIVGVLAAVSLARGGIATAFCTLCAVLIGWVLGLVYGDS